MIKGKKYVYRALTVLGIYIFFAFHLFRFIAPFVVAYLFAMLLNPFVTWLYKKAKVGRGVGTILSMLTILSGVLSLILMIVKRLWYQVIAFARAFPDLSNQLIKTAGDLQQEWQVVLSVLPGTGAFANLDRAIEEILSGVGQFFTAVLPGAYNVVSKVPDMVIFIIVMLIATFFMTRDFEMIKGFIKAQLSEALTEKIVVMQKGLLGALGGYIRTQLILMSITFCICVLGLFVLGVNYWLLIAVVIAVVDALPIFGSGTLLIPWAIYTIIGGNYLLAIGLLCIYGIIFITRQVMEPKILSSQIGVYALVTVMAMYIGYKAVGVFGLILAPIVVVSIKTLQAVGVIPAFKAIKDKKSKGE